VPQEIVHGCNFLEFEQMSLWKDRTYESRRWTLLSQYHSLDVVTFCSRTYCKATYPVPRR